MQLVEGTTLHDAVKAKGKVAEATMRPLFNQLSSALLYLHSRRITHRDLKPDNILVCSTMDMLFICDFNCAHNLRDSATLTCQVGTMTFSSPELLLGDGAVLGEQ